MKNKDIIFLVKAGILNITAHSLPSEQAYKIYKFKKALKDANNSVYEAEVALTAEVGIEDPHAFDARIAELKQIKDLTAEQQKELDALLSTLVRLNEMRKNIYEDDAVLPGIETIPYEHWHKLQDENRHLVVGKRTVDALSGNIEFLLEGVLWTPPFEE